MDYNTRSGTFYRNKVSLATVEGRVEPSFVLPADSPTPYERYVLSDEYEFRESTLRYDATTGEFSLNISTRRTDGDDEVSEDTGHSEQTALGIDLGVRKSLALAQPIRNLRFLRTSTVLPFPRPGASGKATTTTTTRHGSSRSDVERCNSAARRPRTMVCSAPTNAKKRGENNTLHPHSRYRYDFGGRRT